jgi:thioredoxin 1
MTHAVEQINDLNFDREVLASKGKFLLDFSASYCGPCKALDPMVEELAVRSKGRLRVGKLNIDDSPEVAARFGVRGAPTLLLFRDGKEQTRRLGLPSRKALHDMVEL